MQRKYKTDTPENTVERITQILKKMDITARQEEQKSVDGHLFSCLYSLDGIEFFAQNGKGTSMDRDFHAIKYFPNLLKKQHKSHPFANSTIHNKS